jgi:Cu+-exporting ATPase
MLMSLEMNSSHPLAHSIVRELQGSPVSELTSVQEEKGIGISGTDGNGDHWMAGSFRIIGEEHADSAHDIYLLRNGIVYATLDLEDRVKQGVVETITYLKRQGLEPVILSGDRDEKCREVAAQLGIQHIYSQKLPAEKLEIIERLESKGGVAMVGDGINDAPALAKAGVGISLSNATQVAIQSAQVILLNGNIRLLSKAYSISKVTLSVIKQNLFWAFFYNIIAIPIAAAGYLDPMIAAASMALSDTIVVLNSLRLRTRKLA